MDPTTDPLAFVLDPVTRAEFVAKYWETRPLLVSRNRPGQFDALLTMREVDRVLTTEPVVHPDVLVADATRDVKPEDYTYPSQLIDVPRLFARFADGHVPLAFSAPAPTAVIGLAVVATRPPHAVATPPATHSPRT